MDEELQGFFLKDSELNRDDYVILDYFFESTIPPDEAAAHLCQEMSTAQWKREGHDEDFRVLYGAKVLDLVIEREMKRPTYPLLTGLKCEHSYACQVRIAYPVRNIGAKIPNLLTVAAGEGAFFSPGIHLIKLFDITFPPSFLSAFSGPNFGIGGLRDILRAYSRPIFFGVIKPNLGLSPQDFAELAFEAWVGGIDIAKDDEMLFDVSWSPLAERVKAVTEMKRKAEDITGKKKMYLANITDEVKNLRKNYEIAVANGADAVMINGMTTGFSAVRMITEGTCVPVVGHFDFIAAMTRMPYFGLSSKLVTKIQRLVGMDVIIMPGFSPRMKTPEHEVTKNIEECFKPLGSLKKSLPVPGGSDSALTLEPLYRRLGTVDFGFCPGRGVFGHPLGPRAGAKSIVMAWEAIEKGVSLEEYGDGDPVITSAISAFSSSAS